MSVIYLFQTQMLSLNLRFFYRQPPQGRQEVALYRRMVEELNWQV